MIELLLAAERMLRAGDVDHAERLFSQVVEADPKNAIAVVGLARVALEHGDEAGAVAVARRALEIDPENTAASRLLERLEEAVATRAAGRATAEPEAARGAALPSEPPVKPEEEPGPGPGLGPEVRPEHAPAPPPRSWLDRLLGIFRRR